MPRIEKTVFISYRRSSASGWGVAVYQKLTNQGFDVFLDYRGIASGDFEQIILENIKARAHFLVLLTPSALERVDEPGDWFRREIETALASRRNVVPLMLEGFDFSAPSITSRLTGTLQPLRKYQGLTVYAEYFDAAMARLCSDYLKKPVEAVLDPLSTAAREAAVKQGVAARSASVVPMQELTADQWFERGFAAADLDEQVRCYTEVVRLKPDHVNAFLNRGMARHEKGDLDGAFRDYDQTLRLDPDNAEAYYNRGKGRRSQGDLDGALRDYNETIRLAPDYSDAYYNRADIRRDKGDLDGALRDYDEAVGLSPDDADAYNNRGKLRRARGDLDGALRDYDEAIRLKPDYAVLYNNRGIARRAKGDLNGALRDFEEAIRLNADYPDAYNNRGIARRDKGDFNGAAADYSEAIRRRPDFAKAYYNRAIVREQQFAPLAAIADYQKYLDLGGGVQHGDQAAVEDRIHRLQRAR